MQAKRLDLKELGRRLGMIDEHMVALLAQRMLLARQVEEYKRIHGGPIIRSDIEEDRLQALRKKAEEVGLNPNFIFSVLYLVIAESCKVQINQFQVEPKIKELSSYVLKKNLRALTKEIAPLYDDTYGSDFFATKSYLKLEEEVIDREVGTLRTLENLELALDLGCATGRVALKLAKSFQKVVGYDISQAMIRQANKSRRMMKIDNARFRVVDLEKGIPKESNSVSLVVMNLGTASDILDLRRVLISIKRVLKPDGRFVLSFYNSGSLLYGCWFIPWPVSLAASMDQTKHCLSVRLKEKTFLIHARPYSVHDVKRLLQQNGMVISKMLTFPTLSSILPNEFFKDEGMQKRIEEIDRKLMELESGAYILMTGRKTV